MITPVISPIFHAMILERSTRTGTSTNAERQFVWGLRYIDDLVLRDRDTTGSGTLNERLYGLQDPNWNMVALADSTGAVQERYSYDAYGIVTFLTPSFGVRFTSAFAWETLYAGYRRDNETALFSVRNRVLDPFVGWLERDSSGRLTDDANLYRYCGNGPIARIDPDGRWLIVVVVVVAGVYFLTPDTANAPARGDAAIPSNPHAGIPPAAMAGAATGMASTVGGWIWNGTKWVWGAVTSAATTAWNWASAAAVAAWNWTAAAAVAAWNWITAAALTVWSYAVAAAAWAGQLCRYAAVRLWYYLGVLTYSKRFWCGIAAACIPLSIFIRGVLKRPDLWYGGFREPCRLATRMCQMLT